MNLTASQKRIQGRRLQVKEAYNNKGEILTSVMVKNTAIKLGVSEVTIWADLVKEGLVDAKPRTKN